MKVFWHQSDNFGDALTPYILSKLGVEFEYTEKGVNEPHYIMCGSILPAANEHSIIWGAGIAQDAEDIEWKQSKILAVRGKHTREMLLSKGIECPEIYGDPAQILPFIYRTKVEKKYRVGFVPHMVDSREGISITQPVESFVDEILQYEKIVSSSLHALIAAEAYGLEWEWSPCDQVIGGDFKFRDFMETDYNLPEFIETFPFLEDLRKIAIFA